MIIKNSIIKIRGKKPGKTVAIFAGVHGNEKAGILALKKVVKEVNIIAGEVYFVFANPEAIKKDKRQIEKNLNRCFTKNNKGKTAEDELARKLMPILDECDALLDLHASNNKFCPPFIIAEKKAHDLARQMDFGILTWNWNKIEPGATDGYMHQQKKLAICLECGSVQNTSKNISLAEKSIYQFLQYYNCINKKIFYNKRKQRFIKVIRLAHQKTNNFSFVKKFKDFERLPTGKIFACDGKKKYIASKNECIIFPHDDKKIGDEVFIIGRIKKNI